MLMLMNHYLNDGINPQAQAVLALLRNFQIESSWVADRKEYAAEINVNPWYNGRETGYVFSVRHPKTFDNLNIAVYEHRNTDQICAVKWEQPPTLNPICTVEHAKFPTGVFVDKWNVDKSVTHGQILEMVTWIQTELTSYWNNI